MSNMSGKRDGSKGCVLLYTKPARAGRVKTRLIGELSPEQAADLHAAFLGDLLEALGGGRFELRIAWALEDGEEMPEVRPAGGGDSDFRQQGADLGARLYHGLGSASSRFERVAAVGSDHPELRRSTVEAGFRRLAEGADVVLGPTLDGGYYLIGLRRSAVRREIFDGIPWSTDTVLDETLARCREQGLAVELLAGGHDVDVAEDLRLLAARLRATREAPDAGSPRTRALLAEWGRL